MALNLAKIVGHTVWICVAILLCVGLHAFSLKLLEAGKNRQLTTRETPELGVYLALFGAIIIGDLLGILRSAIFALAEEFG